ncbi:MAG: hypothetical protein E7052_02375 [Lentisphaerae bacterium]|nr:hypothetical protein [Lentisphaerota bacterium]
MTIFKSTTALLLTAAAMLLNASGVFEVRKNGNDFAVLYKGQTLIKSLTSSALNQAGDPEVKSTFQTLQDGSKVWNLWREDTDNCIRQEIVLSSDAAQLEISMKGEARPNPRQPDRIMTLQIPMQLIDGMAYRGLKVNTRSWNPGQGIFSSQKTPQGALDKVTWRYLTISDNKDFNVVFDLNPIGPGEYMSQYNRGVIRGVWDVVRNQQFLTLRGGSNLAGLGGMTGCKIVIREGVMDKDYPAHHALSHYHEIRALQVNNAFSFGSLKHGKNFTTVDDAPFDPAKKYGWLPGAKLRRNVDSPEGIYYSSMAGKNAVFRFSGLYPGVHIFTVSAGNFGGHANKFTVSVNGRTMVKDLKVKKAQLAVVSMAVWVGKDGVADIKFDGDFLLSGIASQFLLAEAEDFSFRRGFWVTDGFEASIMFQNQHYKPEAELPPALDLINMPIPGREAAGKLRTVEKPIALPPPDAPELHWRWNANSYHLGGNTATLDECRDPADMKAVFDELQRDGAQAVMINGMMSRHTYPAHLDRSVEMIGKLAREAHKRGMKVIDHQDVILLWNTDSGFRVMAKRLGETVRSMVSMTPNGQMCLMNPELKRQYFDYALRTVKAGIDGLQADEATFMFEICGCSHCRNKFYRDTNWQLPLNELDKRIENRNDPLWKQFLEWRKIMVANWWVDFRREADKINPNLAICMYNTHWGFMSRASSLAIGGDLTQEARAINYFGTEIMSRNCLQSLRPLLPLRRMVNLLNVAFNTPIWSWVYGGLDGEKMYEAFYAGWAVCNMTNQTAMTRWGYPPKRPKTFKHFESSPDNMDRSVARPVAELALLFSASSRDWNKDYHVYPHMLGLAQTLETMHIPYEIIGEMSLKPEVLKKYKSLSINVNGCLSDEQVKVIKDFARQGGTVHLAGVAGMQDAMGNLRKNWAFADVFNFTVKSPTRRNIITSISPAPDRRQLQTLQGKSMWYRLSKPFPKKSLLWGLNENNKLLPVFAEAAYGKGRFYYEIIPLAQLLFFDEGRILEPWRNQLDEKLAAQYAQALRKIFSNALYWQTDAPQKVYSSIYRQDKALAVHFLNGMGAHLKKGEPLPMSLPKVPFPPLKKDITFTIPAENVQSVYAVSPDFDGRKPLSFKANSDQTVTIVLPKDLLKAYTIVWIK